MGPKAPQWIDAWRGVDYLMPYGHAANLGTADKWAPVAKVLFDADLRARCGTHLIPMFRLADIYLWPDGHLREGKPAPWRVP